MLQDSNFIWINVKLLWGKKPPNSKKTGFDNTSVLTADMTFGSSGKFLDSNSKEGQKVLGLDQIMINKNTSIINKLMYFKKVFGEV